MSVYTGEPHKRTYSQNNALHLYYEHLAQELNDSGWTIQKFLSHAVEINWTKDLVKELLWRPIQKMLVEKQSTVQLDKIQEIDIIYDYINRHVSELCGIHVPFPNDPNKIK
jgi:hypothetical protein